tara:strand:+ start:363 stop:536 length:174 start_codon:yes stop_codon:yes gene_type:complete
LKKKERIPMSGGDEWDALSKKSRKLFSWSRGTLKKIKRKYNKRFRQKGKLNGNIEKE